MRREKLEVAYHCHIGIGFEKLGDFSQLVLKVVHPNVLNVRSLI